MPKSKIKLIAWAGSASLLSVVCSSVSCAIFSRYQIKKALMVITTLNHASIGTPSEASIAAIMNAGGSRSDHCLDGKRLNPGTSEPCEGSEEQYGIYLGLPYWLNHLAFELPIFQYGLRYFCVHPWFVEASLSTKSGRLTRIFYLTVATRVDRANVLSQVDISPRDLSEPDGGPPYSVSYVRRRNLIPELHVWISPVLPIQERIQLLDYKLDCLSTLKGCLEPAEISPGLWQGDSRPKH